MKWEEYVAFSSNNDTFDSAAKIYFKFGNSNIVEPSFFTRLNYSFLKTINDIYEKNRIALILPRHSKLLASLVLYKIVYEINTGETKSLSIADTYKKGDKLKLHNAVVTFEGIEVVSNEKYFYVRAGGKNSQRHAWKLDKTPPFVKVDPEEKLTGETTLQRAVETWRQDNKSSLSKYTGTKSLRDRTTLIVGPTNQYKKLFKNTLVNDKPLTHLLSIGFVDSDCNVKPLTEETINYDLILCPDAYSAYELVNDDTISEAICSIFFDISNNDYSNDYLQWVRKIERLNKSIVFCIQENNAFDLKPLIESNYSIFQWKKNYITEQFIFDEKNPDSLLLFAFKERSFERVVFENEVLTKWYGILRQYQEEMQDSDPTLVNAFYQFFLEIINICKNYCFQDDVFMLDRKKVLQQKIDNLDNPYIKNIIGKHPLIAYFKEMINEILNFYSKENDKIEYIITYLIDHPKEKICIVVPDSKHFDAKSIGDYFRNHILSLDVETAFDVLSISGFKECSKEFDTAIFVGWNAKNIMKEALFSNNAYKNIVLLYSIEVPWMNYAMKEWNSESYTNDFTILAPEIEAPIDEPLMVLQNADSEEASKTIESYDSVKTKLNSSLASNKKAHNEYGNNDFVEAALVNFADDTYGIFSRFKSFVCINELLKGNETKPIEKTTEDLLPGDIVLFKDKSKNIIFEIANDILKASNQENMSYIARSWKDAIKDAISFGGLSQADIASRIVEAGCKRHKATIRGWLNSEIIICPIDKEDLICIATACAEFGEDLLNNIDVIYEAAGVVRKAHIQAGFKLSDMILNTTEIKNIVDGYDEYGYFDFPSIEIDSPQLGHITITKVTDIGDFQDYPESICDIREDN